jgi:glucose-1-phosphate thymidylyltransferase
MTKKKGILLAGGMGTRFRPVTYAVNKHFLPIYKKPMFFYPLSVLMLSGIKEILIVSDSQSLKIFKKIISRLNLNVKFHYIPQDNPGGIVDGIIKCKDHVGQEDFMVILGDNFFYAQSLSDQLKKINSELLNIKKIK